MSIVLRQAREKDLNDLYGLAKQFTLLNLPANKLELEHILDVSESSFNGSLDKDKREYLFVAEDMELKKVVAASKIVAKHGNPESPHLYYKIGKKEKFSSDLGLGFIHQTLKFMQDEDGPTELGGLIVDRAYRGRPEKIGKSVSLIRFLYIAAFPDLFEEELHSEFAPPLTAEGRSEFWEALGRRFTGMPYEEADKLSQKNKEFIQSLFPENEIYMTLLESSARLVVGEVNNQTKPARRMLKSLGFKYKEEVDPFDGGPHYGVKKSEALPIKNFLKKHLKQSKNKNSSFSEQAYIVGGLIGGEFVAKRCHIQMQENELMIPEQAFMDLGFNEGQEVFCIPTQYGKK